MFNEFSTQVYLRKILMDSGMNSEQIDKLSDKIDEYCEHLGIMMTSDDITKVEESAQIAKKLASEHFEDIRCMCVKDSHIKIEIARARFEDAINRIGR